MPISLLVLLHAGSLSGVPAAAVVIGLAAFVLVLAYIFSSLQREEERAERSAAGGRKRRNSPRAR